MALVPSEVFSIDACLSLLNQLMNAAQYLSRTTLKIIHDCQKVLA
jgi:hypothetical protein